MDIGKDSPHYTEYGVSMIKPTVAMKMIGNVELERIATTIEKKLKKVFDAIV